jgi:hypothetical protein
MDSTQTQFGPILSGVDAFGAPHLVGDEDRTGDPPAWTGDPSSVPLPAPADVAAGVERSEEDLDRAIFAALIVP